MNQFATLLFLLGMTAVQANTADDGELVAQLDAARGPQEERAAVEAITHRLATGPLNEEITGELTGLLVSRQSLANQHLVGVLPLLLGEQPADPRMVVLLAGSLDSDVILQHHAARLIRDLLAGTVDLPQPAFESLVSALGNVAMINRWAAIEVLSTTPSTDPRLPTAMEAILATLDGSDHPHTRSTAIEALAAMASGGHLPAAVIDSLVRVATEDTDAAVRLDALEALARQPLPKGVQTDLTLGLATDILSPGAGQPARNFDYSREFVGRSRDVLAALHEPPYPDHVVDAWIELLPRDVRGPTLELIAGVVGRDELTAGQRATLERTARSERQYADRAAVYATLYPRLDRAALTDARARFVRSADAAVRTKAGYQLMQHYRTAGVPNVIVHAAAARLTQDVDAETLYVSARLTWDAEERPRHARQQVVDAMRRHADNTAFYLPMFEQLARADPETPVRLFAGDEQLPAEFRRYAIGPLMVADDPHFKLSPDVAARLQHIARTADDYHLIQAAGRALARWDASVPVRVAFTDHQNQSMVLFFVLCATALAAVGAGIVGLVALSRLRSSASRRAMLILGWLALGAGMLVLLLYASVGFLGHNSVPPPIEILVACVPAYLGAIVYAALARVIWRRMRAIASG